jgi:hypothetical protein
MYPLFELNYQKNDNDLLFKDLEKILEMKDVQNYIPIYNNFFELNSTNYNKINLNYNLNLSRVLKSDNESSHFTKCKLVDLSNVEIEKDVFFKYCPLLDPVKLMTGKYDISLDNIELPLHNINSFHPKLDDVNNSAFVDSFFVYLTSQLLHKHEFIHGIDSYGLFLGMKQHFKYNAFDELDILMDSDYFIEHKDDLFFIDNKYTDEFLNDNDSRNNKKRLIIEDNELQGEKNQVNDDIKLEFDNLNHIDDINTNTNDNDNDSDNDNTNDKSLLNILEIYNDIVVDVSSEIKIDSINNNKNTSNHSSESCSSKSSNTTLDSDCDDDASSYETESNNIDDGDKNKDRIHYIDLDSASDLNSYTESCSEYSSEEEIINVSIKEFPVAIVASEKCQNTLDYYMLHNDIKVEEWTSILMQVIMTLITYQKLFMFTHNDLHTNNIMYNETDIKFIYYKYNKNLYKVPTYGKLYKIIDYGRSIYRYKNILMCSDSYHKDGDASTQYNFEPYMNTNKPRLEPNYSFDLCRLACSIYDFLIPETENEDDNEITILITDWCKDDKGRNVLYKSNGEERYPNFKLYKMIARTVHLHLPEKQLNKPIFSKYLYKKNKLKILVNEKLINIDNMSIYHTLQSNL